MALRRRIKRKVRRKSAAPLPVQSARLKDQREDAGATLSHGAKDRSDHLSGMRPNPVSPTGTHSGTAVSSKMNGPGMVPLGPNPDGGGSTGGACKEADKVAKKTLSIKPYRIAKTNGKKPTNAIDLTVTKRILGKAGIEVSEQSTTTINKTRLRDVSVAVPPTREEKKIWANYSSTSHAALMSVKTFSMNNTSSRTNGGGGTTLVDGKKAVTMVVHDGSGWLAAHELGHAIGGDHAPHGTDANGSDTVMKPTNSPDVAGTENVSKALMQTWRAHPLVTGNGSKVCPDTSD